MHTKPRIRWNVVEQDTLMALIQELPPATVASMEPYCLVRSVQSKLGPDRLRELKKNADVPPSLLLRIHQHQQTSNTTLLAHNSGVDSQNLAKEVLLSLTPVVENLLKEFKAEVAACQAGQLKQFRLECENMILELTIAAQETSSKKETRPAVDTRTQLQPQAVPGISQPTQAELDDQVGYTAQSDHERSDVFQDYTGPDKPLKRLQDLPRLGDKFIVYIYDINSHHGSLGFIDRVLHELAPNVLDIVDLQVPNVRKYVTWNRWVDRDLTLYCPNRARTDLSQNDWVKQAEEKAKAGTVLPVSSGNPKDYAAVINSCALNWMYPE